MQLNVLQEKLTMGLFLKNQLNVHIYKKVQTIRFLSSVSFSVVFLNVSQALHGIFLPCLISDRWEDLRAPKPRGQRVPRWVPGGYSGRHNGEPPGGDTTARGHRPNGGRSACTTWECYNELLQRESHTEEITNGMLWWGNRKKVFVQHFQNQRLILYELFTFGYVHFKIWICASMYLFYMHVVVLQKMSHRMIECQNISQRKCQIKWGRILILII